jgi:hypothetical protein
MEIMSFVNGQFWTTCLQKVRNETFGPGTLFIVRSSPDPAVVAPRLERNWGGDTGAWVSYFATTRPIPNALSVLS